MTSESPFQLFQMSAFKLFVCRLPPIRHLTALAARQAVPPLTGLSSPVYRPGSHRVGSSAPASETGRPESPMTVPVHGDGRDRLHKAAPQGCHSRERGHQSRVPNAPFPLNLCVRPHPSSFPTPSQAGPLRLKFNLDITGFLQ